MSNRGGRAAPTNPFYSNPTPTSSATPPPSYQQQPQQYSSLADLTRGRAVPAPPPPPPSNTTTATGSGRKVPPLPKDGMMHRAPDAPPRRTYDTQAAQAATVQTPPARAPGGSSGISSYIPAGAQSAASSAGERIMDGFNSVATTQRKDQVLSGIGKLGMGAVKLGAKGVYQVGKFATK